MFVCCPLRYTDADNGPNFDPIYVGVINMIGYSTMFLGIGSRMLGITFEISTAHSLRVVCESHSDLQQVPDFLSLSDNIHNDPGGMLPLLLILFIQREN